MEYMRVIVAIVLICILIGMLKFYRSNPFRKYPYYIKIFDVSGKRNPVLEDYIDRYLIDFGYGFVEEQHTAARRWKQECHDRINRSLFKKHRYQQYSKMIDDSHAFRFGFSRRQTRYRQRNYVKTAYNISQVIQMREYSYHWIKKRYEALQDIGLETTLSEYHIKNQRKLATRKLREQIMKRDNYTCQICGKYMPDEVGLQIDHIIPVVKGGKTVPSNLQVLCSKCNGKKSNKVE